MSMMKYLLFPPSCNVLLTIAVGRDASKPGRHMCIPNVDDSGTPSIPIALLHAQPVWQA
ncbi:hypothetical protein KDA_52290 [Dictyobacter alpinus]|uniref:Uncharacterized protein n=1 Tax=Dictyobacter alpinus TaxID=2014873 RepID=A0A402BEE9_9CHLR|nr:hypothetical protein KDA_52290 [Dictyobacter alpinus]